MKTIKHLMLYAVGITSLSLTSCNEGDNIGTDLPSQTQRTQKVRFVINPLQIPQRPNNGDPPDITLIPTDNTYARIVYKTITNEEGAKVQSASIQYGAGVYESEMKCGHYQLLRLEVFNMGADHKPDTDDDYIGLSAPNKEDLKKMSLPPEITDYALPINFTVDANIDAKIAVPVIPHHEPDDPQEMGNIGMFSIYGLNLKWLDFRLRVEMGYFTEKYIGNYKLIIQRGSDTIAESTFGRFTDDQTTARWIDILYDPAKTDDIDLSVIYKDEDNNTFKGVKTIAYKDWLEKVDPHGVPYSIMRSVVLVHLSKI